MLLPAKHGKNTTGGQGMFPEKRISACRGFWNLLDRPVAAQPDQ